MARNFDAEAVMAPLVDRSVEADLATEGDTVHVQKFGDVTVSDYTVGTDFAATAVTLTDDTLVLDQQKAFHFTIDDIEDAESHLNLLKGFTERAMISMAHAIDDRLLGHYADVDAGNIIGSDLLPETLTPNNIYDYFVDAGKLLDDDNIPDNRFAVIDTATKAVILKSPDFIKATATGDAVVRNGILGELAGFNVVVSNRIATVSGVNNLMFFHPELISLAVRIPPNRFKEYDVEKQFGRGVKGLSLYGSKVFNPTAGVVLKKAA